MSAMKSLIFSWEDYEAQNLAVSPLPTKPFSRRTIWALIGGNTHRDV
jgi:hypothetical protein